MRANKGLRASIRRELGYALQMVWRDQDPPATDVLLDFTVPFSDGGTPAYLEIDKLPEGLYRATVGTLFECQELCRTGDLEGRLCCIDALGRNLARSEAGIRRRDRRVC